LGVFLLAAAVSDSVRAQQVDAAQAREDERAASSSGRKPAQATDLDRVIVTGVRAPKAVDKIPGAISIITPEEIRQSLVITEDNTAVLARTIPGYAESSQAMTNSGESLRGRIPLRLFDSIPQGSPLREGTRNGTFTDMGVIGRIEVINGPSAAEGIGATGGVINYISKVPEHDGSETTISARYQTQFHDDSVGWKLGLSHAIKQDNYDFLASVSQLERGMAYDAKGRSIGMNSSGSLADSQSRNLYMKGGFNFGQDGEQRLQATYSNFNIGGNGDYIQYTHNDFFGGTLDLVGYQADQGMRFLPENGADRQLVKPAPADDADRIFDQSEIQSEKKGLRTSWTRPTLFGVDGLELHTGVDFVQDVAQQRLVMTDRVWVPPMDYKSVAPYAQLSWDIGPVTVSGGLRRENGELDVDSYTTVAYRNSVFVEGGTLDYTANLPNIGAIWRVTDQFSLFSAYSKGFTLPDIGIPLRNVNYTGQSVKGILDLQAIIVDNIDIGFNWRGSRGALSGSWYHSTSDFGASLEVDPLTSDFIMTRAPTDIKGIEFTGEFRFTDTFKITGLYTHLRGWTSFWGPDPQGRYDAGPLKKPLGIFDATPDKINVALVWKALPNLDATLGASMLRDRHLTSSAVREYDGETFDYDEKINGYTLWDLGVNYDSGRFGTFSLGVDNLFNKYYILSGSQGDGWQNYWAGRGRVVSLSYSYTFR
jgi:iron complex outermembrane receptor protein